MNYSNILDMRMRGEQLMPSKRELQIVNEIIRNPEIKSGDIQTKLSLTKRQISYSIKKINDELGQHDKSLIRRNKNGTFLIDKSILAYFINASKFHKSKADQTSAYTYHNEHDRVILLILYILTSQEELALVHIYDYLKVSRNTAMSDLKKVAAFIARYNLQLQYSRNGGYQIIGEEIQIRVLISNLVEKVLRFPDGLNEFSSIAHVQIELLIHFVRKIERSLSITYSDDAFNFLIRDLQIIISRNLSYSYPAKAYFHERVMNTKEFYAVREYAYPEWVKQSDDLEWMALSFLASNIFRGNPKEKDQQLQLAIKQMVELFQDRTYVEINDRQSFEKRLLAHIRPAYFRVKYGLMLGNLGIEDVVKKDESHAALLDAVKVAIKPLEALAGKTFPENELELISFYFGYELSDNKELIPQLKKRATVVCSNGLIVSKLMINNLRDLFPEINFISSSSVREFESFQQDYDLVFTTVPVHTEVSQYIINPIMDRNEEIRLRTQVLNDTGISAIEGMVNDLVKAVRESATVKNEKLLRKRMKQVLVETSEDDTSNKELPSLNHYLKYKNVQLVDQKLAWKSSIKVAAQPLVESGVITDNYVQQMIKQNDTPTGYSFLGKSMAIPHASVEDGIYSDGFGFLISKQPIIFPGNHQVNFVVPIAIFNTTQHLLAINQLSEIAENQEVLTTILKMTDVNKVNQYIRSVIEKLMEVK